MILHYGLVSTEFIAELRNVLERSRVIWKGDDTEESNAILKTHSIDQSRYKPTLPV
jgi:hypothetical protein